MAKSTERPRPAWVDEANAALVTDLYELTMAAAYHAHGLDQQATFELFVRRLPPQRNFLVACGLEQALDYLATVRFTDDALAYVDTLGLFEPTFLERLRSFRFSGDVWAVPEGEVVFAGEPLVSVTAPMLEAQLVETFLLTTVLSQTMVASKAARVAIACDDGRTFADFSGRRVHGADAAVKAARAAFVGGAASTSNVLAGHLFGIPLSGTMAHAYVMAFADEMDAFRCFARTFPRRAVLLIDTYDTEAGARHAVQVARELAAEGVQIQGVRLDSGDLGPLAHTVRHILDEGGCPDIRIVASGDLDEHRIAALVGDGAPIDAFGVGTQLGTSGDAPWLGGVYKLVEDVRGPKMKRSPGKVSLPGRKQVHRYYDDTGTAARDIIALHGEPIAGGRPLLVPVMQRGEVVHREPLASIRRRADDAVASLPAPLRRLDTQEPFAIELSAGLERLAHE